MPEPSGGVLVTVRLIADSACGRRVVRVADCPVTCDAETTLGEVRRTVAPHLMRFATAHSRDGRYLPAAVSDWSVGFQAEDGQGSYMPYAVNVVTASGEILFSQPILDVTVSELRTTAELGILPVPIDPTTILLYPLHGLGNGDEIPEILRCWSTLRSYLPAVIAGAAGNLLYSAVAKLAKVLAARFREFRTRNAEPQDVLNQVLIHSHWRIDEMRLRFGLSADESADLLDALGYVPSSTEPGTYVSDWAHRQAERRRASAAACSEDQPPALQLPEVALMEHDVVRALIDRTRE